jgi:hypothetical protein
LAPIRWSSVGDDRGANRFGDRDHKHKEIGRVDLPLDRFIAICSSASDVRIEDGPLSRLERPPNC